MSNRVRDVWICWFQGEGDASVPALNQECMSRWRKLNTDANINILDIRTIKNYVPEFFDIVKQSPHRTWQAKSDLLRILLLSKYGGVWADASVLPMQKLSTFYSKIVNNTGFFAYRFFPRKITQSNGSAEIVSWFMCVDNPKHAVIEKIKTAFIERFKIDKHWQYLTFHDVICNLYDTDQEVFNLINNMVQIDMKIPSSALHKGWDFREESFLYKRPCP